MENFTRRTFNLLAISATAMTGCQQGQTRPFYCADSHAPDYPTVKALEYMGKLLHEETNGRLGIRIYSGGQLGGEKDTLELTIFGGLDLNRINLSPLNSIVPETIVLSLPFLFNSVDHLYRGLESPAGNKVLNALEPHGLIGLCYYDSGARSLYNSKRPIYTPSDMEGLKIRVQNSEIFVSMIEAFGANATPMNFSEVYQGLLQRVIDGAENNWPSYETTRHFEVAKHYSLTEHVMAPEVLVMSRLSWNKLSLDDKNLIRHSAKKSVTVMRGLWQQRVNAAKQRLNATDMKLIADVDKKAFQDLMNPVWHKFMDKPLLSLAEEFKSYA